MIICICSNANEGKVRELIKRKKIKSIREFVEFGICNDCKKCSLEITKIIKETRYNNDN